MGASNNGVEQVREVRRMPGCAPAERVFKDLLYRRSAHALDRGVQRAVEDPGRAPPHVKFFFATTEANKIPITCPVSLPALRPRGHHAEVIGKTLAEICAQEGVAAEPEALQIVRPPRIRLAPRCTVAPGPAPGLRQRGFDGRNRPFPPRYRQRRTPADDARGPGRPRCRGGPPVAGRGRPNEGVQPAELLGGVLDFSAMASCCRSVRTRFSCPSTPRPATPARSDRRAMAGRLDPGALQILAEHRTRLRGSLHGRLLVEMALVRVARLDDLATLETLVERLDRAGVGHPARSEAGGRPP